MSALSLSNPESKGSIALQWIGAHLLAQVVCIGTGLLAFGAAKLFGIATGPAASYLSVAFALMLATEAIFIAASAWLRGAVLRRVLPRFEMVPWMIVVALYMLAFAQLSGFSTRLPTTDAPAAITLTTQAVLNGAMIATIMGAIVGLLIGGLEALVIRRAAEGAGLWVLMTMVAWGALLATLVTSSLLLVTLGATSGIAAIAGGVAMKFASALLMALLTLPAVLHITPRMIEPAPVPA